MRCNHIRKLIPQWLDGELDAAEARTIEKHISTCAYCSKEVEFWRDIGTVLKEDAAEIKAPEGFAGSVMAELPQQRSRHTRFMTGWKRSVAAAAAFLLVAAGSLGAYLNWGTGSDGQVADNGNQPAHIAETDNNGDNNGKFMIPGTGKGDSKKKDDNAGENKDSNINDDNNESNQQTASNESSDSSTQQPGEDTENTGTETDNNNSGSKDSEGDASIAGTGEDTQNNDTNQDTVLLSTDKKRIVENTVLKIEVNDMETAYNKAVTYAKSNGASYENLSTGTHSRSIKITSNSSSAPALIGKLKETGTVKANEKTTRDRTAEYNELVERYRSLSADLKSAGEQEKTQIERQMESIYAELERLNKQASGDKETIILWLES